MTQAALNSMAYELLERGEGLRFTARGHSMWPYILDGDVVEIRPRESALHVGEVVFVPNQEFGQLHRVVDIDDCGRALVRGDALPAPDGWFDPNKIMGVLGEVSRKGQAVHVRRGRNAVRIARILSTFRRFVHGIRHR